MTTTEAMENPETTESIEPAAPRRSRQVYVQLGWRIALVVIAGLAVAIGLPAWVRAPLSLAAAAVTLQYFIVRTRRRGLLESVLVALAVVVASLAILGLVLNILPAGIDTVRWGVGVGIIELEALVALTLWRDPIPGRARIPRPSRSAIVWSALIAGVLSGALLWSVASFNSTHVAPLAISATPSGDSVVVTVSSGSDEGPFEIHFVTPTSRTVLADDVRIAAGDKESISVDLPDDIRGTVELVRAGTTTPVRELVLDTTNITPKVTG